MKYCHRLLAYSYGKPEAVGRIKKQNSDFIVTEQLGFELSGNGEHQWVFVEKDGMNTQEVRHILAKLAGIPLKNTGYSGLKDKNAITRQWFSLYLPGKPSVNFAEISHLPFQVLKSTRHTKKLKTGAHKYNQFDIKVFLSSVDQQAIKERIELLGRYGFANYFGEQRFGNKESNVAAALDWLNKNYRLGKAKRSLYLSVIRSLFFNLCLSQRIENKMWDRAEQGDYLMLSGTNSIFPWQESQALQNQQRLLQKDINLCHLLPGGLPDYCNRHEKMVLDNGFDEILQMLAKHNCTVRYRSIRAFANKLQYQFDAANNLLHLSFVLDRGVYATSFLREIIHLQQ